MGRGHGPVPAVLGIRSELIFGYLPEVLVLGGPACAWSLAAASARRNRAVR